MECFYRKCPNLSYEAIRLDKLQGNVHSAVSLSVINFLFFNMCAQCVYKYIYIHTHRCMYSQSREKEKVEEHEGVLQSAA